jgi:hypothetical protein
MNPETNTIHWTGFKEVRMKSTPERRKPENLST